MPVSHQGKPSGAVNENASNADVPSALGAAAPPQPQGGSSGDAPPSNTASHGYNGKQEYRLLRVGVDSLYLSYYGDLFPAIEHELTERKYQAQSRYPAEKALAQWGFGNQIFEVSDKGQQHFAFILQNNSYRICVRKGQSGKLPVAYVQISSELLAHTLLSMVVEELGQIISKLTESVDAPVVSRVDLYADFQTDTDIGAIHRGAWITEASGIDTYSRSGKFTGWVFGAGGTVSARLYDKTIEIEKSHKSYFHELWKRGGWDGASTVWRLEFQFRREVLQGFRIRTCEQLQDNLGGLWLAGVNSWLRLVVPDPADSNRARWPVHPIWEYLGQIRWRLDDEPLTRSYTPARVPSLDKLYRMFTALLTSYMCVKGLTVYGDGCIKLMEDCREYHEGWCKDRVGIEFPEWLEQKLNLKARDFNTRKNRKTIRQEASIPDEVEKDASDYYKKSKGE